MTSGMAGVLTGEPFEYQSTLLAACIRGMWIVVTSRWSSRGGIVLMQLRDPDGRFMQCEKTIAEHSL